MFDAKGKEFRMEWTRMKENKNHTKTLFRVIEAYKKPLLLGFFLGISLVLGVFLTNQVIGNEITPITFSEEKEESSQLEREVTVDNSVTEQANETDISSETETTETKDTQGTGPFKPNDSSDQIVDGFDESVEETIPAFKKKQFNVLLVGVDQRPNEKTFSNTDTLLVASINTVNGQVALLSIPR
ncbi:MAG: transcriptional attenuator, LytR family, partial [Firmicutes bacterium]|nr:transcriptional attenuator, LytR family [Bacillota bacterium]